MAGFDKLTSDFVSELIKACLTDVKVLTICKEHLKYQFLETEVQKQILKYIFDFSDIAYGNTPTLGMIGQAFSNTPEVIKYLNKIKGVTIVKGDESSLLDILEDWIRKRRLLFLHQSQFPELYNAGKHDEAIELLAEESAAIQNFKIKDKLYTTVFGGFEERQEKRIRAGKDLVYKQKCPFGIHELDDLTYGGGSKGTSACFLARSGVGKTTLGRWIGLSNARLGKRVVHFFSEGTEEEHKDAYDAAWTSVPLREIEYGEIDAALYSTIIKTKKYILESGGEIIIYAVESFDSMTIEDCYEIIKDVEKNIGKVDVAIFDYMEEFNVTGKFSNTESGERKRRLTIANKITNIATDLKLFSVTFTQANDIKPEKWNNADYVLTRSDISEYKGAIKPFSYFITLNQTMDEKRNEIMRLFCEKFRKYPDGQTIHIYQSRNNGRFYDSQKTIEHFYTKV